MPGLAEMLQQSGGAPPDDAGGGPPMPPQGGPPGQGGDMPVQQAIQVMQKLGVTPDNFPMIAKAVIAIIQAQGQGGAQGAGPSGPQGGPPMPRQMMPQQ